MLQALHKRALEFGIAILLLAGCLIGLSITSVIAGIALAFIPGIGILVLNLLTAAGEYTSRYLGYLLMTCMAYAFAISLIINSLVRSENAGRKFKTGRAEIYLRLYTPLILYVLPTILWETNRMMGYR